ncbi:RTA1 domain protein [Penicillium diatomitis]|uniref:RTA1 domain protein n=1 Tax=Penicillium diatomitis TaxID=2819901 RepID=A0A9W9XCW6_9EURO|nr:RTA1 domain protein [Penicillium diatomitis]KAJ5488976.1 RTA1 domain protein [Penicillium diatomitis]
MQSVCILLAPVLFAASVYMVLGRLIRSIGADEHSIIPVRWLTRTFVSSDIICFLVQGSGSGLMAMGSSASMGKSIVLAGLAIQVLMFGLFIVVSFEFERRLNRTASVGRFDISVQWKIHLRVLNVVCALILVRSVFRVIEYALGNDGYLLSHEWSIYIFDSVPMTAVMALWAKWHPGMFRGSKSRADHDPEWEMRSDGLESANERSVWGRTKDVQQNTGPPLDST